jgi:hypothetical protein
MSIVHMGVDLFHLDLVNVTKIVMKQTYPFEAGVHYLSSFSGLP